MLVQRDVQRAYTSNQKQRNLFAKWDPAKSDLLYAERDLLSAERNVLTYLQYYRRRPNE
jgi:hypothetical protein